MNQIIKDLGSIEIYNLINQGSLKLPTTQDIMIDGGSCVLFNGLIDKISQNLISKWSNSYANEMRYIGKYASYALSHYCLSQVIAKKGTLQQSIIKILMSIGVSDIIISQV